MFRGMFLDQGGHLLQEGCNGWHQGCRLVDQWTSSWFDRLMDRSNLECLASWNWPLLRQVLDNGSSKRGVKSGHSCGLNRDNMNLPFSFLFQFLDVFWGIGSFTCRLGFPTRPLARRSLYGSVGFLGWGSQFFPCCSRGNRVCLFQHWIAWGSKI